MATNSVVATPAARRAMIRERQRALYGVPLRTLINGLLEYYGITQARLASAVGISPAMLSQLISAQRIEPGLIAHTRLMILDQYRDASRGSARAASGGLGVEAILSEVARIQQPWPRHQLGRVGSDSGSLTDVLRGAGSSEQLANAAARLADEFPRIADVLRQAAASESG